MGAAETIQGQLDATEGLVWWNSSKTPFDSLVPHVGCASESQARVQSHYTAACVAVAATDPSFRMLLMKPASP